MQQTEGEQSGGAIRVRPATREDDDALADFFTRYHHEFAYELGEQDVAGEGQRARDSYAGGALLVAEQDGAVVGQVAYEPWGAGRCRMKRMFVPEERRGQGLGRHLAIALLQHARDAGFERMVLDTTRAMRAARRLYESLGFEEFEPDYEAPCRCTVYMQRQL